MKDKKDLAREEEMDRKVGVVKDLKRVGQGDIGGVLRDDIEELKSDVKAADDKIEDAFDGDDNDTRKY